MVDTGRPRRARQTPGSPGQRARALSSAGGAYGYNSHQGQETGPTRRLPRCAPDSWRQRRRRPARPPARLPSRKVRQVAHRPASHNARKSGSVMLPQYSGQTASAGRTAASSPARAATNVLPVTSRARPNKIAQAGGAGQDVPDHQGIVDRDAGRQGERSQQRRSRRPHQIGLPVDLIPGPPGGCARIK